MFFFITIRFFLVLNHLLPVSSNTGLLSLFFIFEVFFNLYFFVFHQYFLSLNKKHMVVAAWKNFIYLLIFGNKALNGTTTSLFLYLNKYLEPFLCKQTGRHYYLIHVCFTYIYCNFGITKISFLSFNITELKEFFAHLMFTTTKSYSFKEVIVYTTTNTLMAVTHIYWNRLSYIFQRHHCHLYKFQHQKSFDKIG